jgi:hypothetical protein
MTERHPVESDPFEIALEEKTHLPAVAPFLFLFLANAFSFGEGLSPAVQLVGRGSFKGNHGRERQINASH